MATKKITLETLATQLAKMDARVVKMDTHMVKMDTRMVKMDDRMVKMDGRMGKMDGRMVKMDDRVAKMDVRMTEGFAKQGREIHDLTESVAFVVTHMATKDDIAEIRKDMATKEYIVALHTQVNSIEIQLRDMKHTKLQSRVADIEEEVFGKTRA